MPSAFATSGIAQAAHYQLRLSHALLKTSRADNLQHGRYATDPHTIAVRSSTLPTKPNQPGELLQKRLRGSIIRPIFTNLAQMAGF